ncbi:cytochrome P450 [Fodinicola feengrottensis]|uniref:cytochrome P450 n=1 Tax=Fodinicola feengrottensis TaxID=435914 RepID=UPI0013D349A6|nr:cytochrome P450 [Fodinicola feengrottensis]
MTASWPTRSRPTYNHLRENDPVVRIDYPGHRLSVWFITRYEDVRAAFVDPRFCKDRTTLGSDCPLASTAHHDPELVALTRCLNMVDDPEHTRLRRLVSTGFTPRRVKQMETEARAYANKLIDAVVADGRMDLVANLANPLSFDIIGGMIGGLPDEEGRGFDRVRLRELGQRLTTPINGTTPLEYNEIKHEIKRLTLDLIERRRGSDGGDSFSAFVQANERGEITDDELLAMIVTLVVGGMDTTASFIATAFHSLLTNPEQLKGAARAA